MQQVQVLALRRALADGEPDVAGERFGEDEVELQRSLGDEDADVGAEPDVARQVVLRVDLDVVAERRERRHRLADRAALRPEVDAVREHVRRVERRARAGAGVDDVARIGRERGVAVRVDDVQPQVAARLVDEHAAGSADPEEEALRTGRRRRDLDVGNREHALAVREPVVRPVAVDGDLEEVAREADAACPVAEVAAVRQADSMASGARGDRDVHALDVGGRRVAAERARAVLAVDDRPRRDERDVVHRRDDLAGAQVAVQLDVVDEAVREQVDLADVVRRRRDAHARERRVDVGAQGERDRRAERLRQRRRDVVDGDVPAGLEVREEVVAVDRGAGAAEGAELGVVAARARVEVAGVEARVRRETARDDAEVRLAAVVLVRVAGRGPVARRRRVAARGVEEQHLLRAERPGLELLDAVEEVHVGVAAGMERRRS